MSFIFRREKCRLMMIEPPRQFLRRRVLEIHDRVFIPVEHRLVEEEIAGPMKQASVCNFRIAVNSFEIKARECGRRSHAVKAVAVIKDAKFHFWNVYKKLVILTILSARYLIASSFLC